MPKIIRKRIIEEWIEDVDEPFEDEADEEFEEQEPVKQPEPRLPPNPRRTK